MSSKEETLKELNAKIAAAEAREKLRKETEGADEKINAMIREAERKLRASEDADALKAAFKKYGPELIARIETSDGMIIMRGYTEAEWDELQAETDTLKLPADIKLAVFNANMKLVIHPSQERTREIVAKFPRLKPRMDVATARIADGKDAAILGKAQP